MEPFPFIVGCARSGTTLLRHMFDSHPEMAVPYESRVSWGMTKQSHRYEQGSFAIDRFVRDLFSRWGFDRWGLAESDVRSALTSAQVASAADGVRVVYRTYARSHGKERYGEKTPSNAFNIGDLASTFPESRFIHLVRDGRNVGLSMNDTEWWKRSLTEAFLTWKITVEEGRAQGAKLDASRYREVRYEDLVRDPHGTLESLCGFVELDFHPQMLRYHERADDILKDQARPHEFVNLTKPPTEGARDWRRALSRRDVERAEAAAGDLLDAFGYERDGRAGLGARAAVSATRARMASRDLYTAMRRGARRLTGRTRSGPSR